MNAADVDVVADVVAEVVADQLGIEGPQERRETPDPLVLLAP